MILGLSGLKDSGKDSVAAYLIKEHGFERRAFADPMKKSIAALLGIHYHEVDLYKRDDGFQIKLVDGGMVEVSLTFKEFIERFANSHREVFGDNFWLDFTMPMGGFYSGRNIVITDMKYDNEAVRIRSCGGYRVRVQNPAQNDKPRLPSELIDYTINGVTEETIEDMILTLATADARYKLALRDE